MVMDPDWILGNWGHNWYHVSPLSVTLGFCVDFQSSSMDRSTSSTLSPWSYTWRILVITDWILGGWGHSWYHGLHLSVILDMCANFQLSSINKRVPRTPCPWNHTLKASMVLYWSVWVGRHSSHQGSQLYVIFELCANCQLSNMTKSEPRTTCPWSPTCRMLMVSDS